MSSTSANKVLVEFLRHIELGREVLQVALEAAEANAGMTIAPTGAGHCTDLFRAALAGDPKATRVTNAIGAYLQRVIGPPPTPVECLTCSQPLHTEERDISVVLAVYASVDMPSAIALAPVCTRCVYELPMFDDLLHEIMQRLRQWLPDLHVTTHISEPGHA